MTLWTAQDAAAATGGRTVGDWSVTGLSIDTRDIAPGDMFIALKDVRDGHDFVAAALEKGAGAAMVSRVPDGIAEDAPLLIVPDVLQALNDLGAAGRARTRARVIGITGSVGKTSTKEMLRAALTRQGKVHAAERSFNNHWGVPLTLARCPVDADFAIIEIGMNHPGEIAPLARLSQLHVAMITTVAAAHLEAFDDIEGIAGEKATIFDGLLADGIAVVNGDLDTTAILSDAAYDRGARLYRFGEDEANAHRLLEARLNHGVTVCRAEIGDIPILFKLMCPGRHFALNATGVLGVVSALGGDLALAAQGLMAWQPPQGRGTLETLLMDRADPGMRFDLIDDAFNANPTSMAASLDVLASATPIDRIGRFGKGRRIAILGDMLELGPDAVSMHKGLASLPSLATVDIVHCVGPLMRHLYDILPEHQRGHHADNARDLVARAHGLVDAGDVLLVKGSKGIKVSLVVDALRKLGHPLPTETEDLS